MDKGLSGVFVEWAIKAELIVVLCLHLADVCTFICPE